MKIGKKLMVIAMAAIMMMAFMPSMAFASTQRAASGVMISDAQFASAKSIKIDTAYVFGNEDGADITAEAYKYKAVSSGTYMFYWYNKNDNNELYYSTGKGVAGKKIVLNDSGDKIITLSKGKTYYFYFDSSVQNESGYLKFDLEKIAGSNAKRVSGKNKITIPAKATVMFSFKPAATGYYQFYGNAGKAPKTFDVIQTTLKSTALGQYADRCYIYGDPDVKGTDKLSIYMFAEDGASGMLRLTKGVTYYYSITSSSKITNFYLKKYSPIEIKLAAQGCKVMMDGSYQDSIKYDYEHDYATKYSTIYNDETIKMAYFPESGKTLKSVSINGEAVGFGTADAEIIEYYDADGNTVDNQVFYNGACTVTEEFADEHPEFMPYLTKTEIDGVTQYYYTPESLAKANESVSHKTLAAYKYVQVSAPENGWKTGDTITLNCQ